MAFVPGIEISADPYVHAAPDDADTPRRGTLHILGLFVDHADAMLAAVHERMSMARDERNPAIVTKLKSLGYDIDYAEVQAVAADQGTRIIGRPHIAQVLIEKGHVASVGEAFQRLIG